MSKQLHVRLRQAREQRGLSLAAIAHERGVRESNLVLIEQDAFEQLPTGLYGRTAVRAYAAAVGLCADDAIAEVGLRLREPEDPMNGLARVRGIVRPPSKMSRAVDPPQVSHATAIGLPWRPQVAALIDLAILVAIDLALVELTALAAGVRTPDILRPALPALILLFALIGGAYFVLLGGVRKSTIGARIAQAPAYEHMIDGADAHTVMQRTIQYVMAEASSFASWVVATDHARQWMRTLREKRA
ncbi:MAG TPA: helix-turn-helix domain-containing protein [Vicinamibacterales bacterium]